MDSKMDLKKNFVAALVLEPHLRLVEKRIRAETLFELRVRKRFSREQSEMTLQR